MSKELQYVVRFVILFGGLALLGLGVALTIHAELGVSPWTVFHVGISNITGLTVGRVTQVVGFVVVVAGTIFFRERPGIATLINMFAVGWFVDLFLGVTIFQQDKGIITQVAYLIIGIVTTGVGTGMYISAHLGAGPRDGIMLGFARLSGWQVGKVRSAIEAVVLVVGFLLGGPVGLGTVVGIAVGPVVQWSLYGLEKLWEVLHVNDVQQQIAKAHR